MLTQPDQETLERFAHGGRQVVGVTLDRGGGRLVDLVLEAFGEHQRETLEIAEILMNQLSAHAGAPSELDDGEVLPALLADDRGANIEQVRPAVGGAQIASRRPLTRSI